MRKAQGPGGEGREQGNIWKFLILEISLANTITPPASHSNSPEKGPREGGGAARLLFAAGFLGEGGPPVDAGGGACSALTSDLAAPAWTASSLWGDLVGGSFLAPEGRR